MSPESICGVCASPAASSLHFGARTCKACAAFFRRTVAMNIVYKCHGKRPPCRVHHELRMACKHCRYNKCIEASMKRHLVQSRRGVGCKLQEDPNPHTDTASTSVSPCTTTPTSSESRINGFPNTCISPSFDHDDETIQRVTKHYMKMEAALNDRRKIMYTDAKMRDVFNTICECPFERRHLRPFDYRTYSGNARPDFIMLYDYANSFLDFDRLEKAEKNMLYRYSCAVDCVMDTAFYTCRLGFDDKILVLTSAEYIMLNPLPLSGEEPNAESFFPCKEDFEKYKSLVPPKIAQWKQMIEPFHALDVPFSEFCLLKALACWHISTMTFMMSVASVIIKTTTIGWYAYPRASFVEVHPHTKLLLPGSTNSPHFTLLQKLDGLAKEPSNS